MRLSHGLIIAVAGATLALAGCGGGSSDQTAGKSAEQILSVGSVQTRALTSYHVAVTAKVNADLAAGAVSGNTGDILRQPIDLSGEGDVRKPGDLSFDLTTTLGTIPLQMNITKVGGGLYASVFGQDIKIDLPADAVSSVDPGELAPAIASWMAHPTIVGNEDVDGAPTVHIRGGVDVAALMKDVGGLAGQLGATGKNAVTATTTTQATDALEKGQVDVWVGTDDLYIHRADADVTLKGTIDAVPQVTALTLALSSRLSDFNGDVQIAAPEGARTIGVGSVAGLLGG